MIMFHAVRGSHDPHQHVVLPPWSPVTKDKLGLVGSCGDFWMKNWGANLR